MDKTCYKLVKASISQADEALRIFKIGLSPTSLESLTKYITWHALAMQDVGPKPMDLIGIIIGLMLKLLCDKEVQAFLKAEEAADAAQDK